MNRDNLGRFTTAQHADALAAERLLERAVAEAVAAWESAWRHQRTCGLCTVIDTTREDVTDRLERVRYAASLLIDRRPAA